jgi:nanoRNase/pAp phosphatase (c-di-AMP/oligoRNAs hydrolase)
MIIAADVTLPDNAGYVVGAYLVFLVLLLIYVTIMASKLSRFERELTELNRIAEDAGGPTSGGHMPASGTPGRDAA